MDEETRLVGNELVLATWLAELNERGLVPVLIIAQEARVGGKRVIMPGGPGMGEKRAHEIILDIARGLKE